MATTIDTDDVRQFVTLYPEMTEAKIADDYDAWANEGLNPATDGDSWTDTQEGSHWWIATRQMIRGDARIYDLMGSEYVRAIFPQWAWGEYLDDHAELRGIGRNNAVKATGAVTFTGVVDTVVAAGTVVGVPPSEPGATAPEYETTAGGKIPAGGTLTLPIEARVAGLAGTVSALAVTSVITETPGIVSVVNAGPIVGGADVENDENLSERTVTSFSGSAVANHAYYRRIALETPGIGRATIVTTPEGPGTIRIIVSTAEGGQVAQTAIDDLQARLDPIGADAGTAAGQTGASIEVVNAQALPIVVAGPVEMDAGYTLDGAAGTIATLPAIYRAIRAYVESIAPGGEIVRQRVIAAIVGVTGVHDVGAITINGQAANVAVGTNPPRAPQFDQAGSAITAGTV